MACSNGQTTDLETRQGGFTRRLVRTEYALTKPGQHTRMEEWAAPASLDHAVPLLHVPQDIHHEGEAPAPC
jgi:hypothetical protein